MLDEAAEQVVSSRGGHAAMAFFGAGQVEPKSATNCV